MPLPEIMDQPAAQEAVRRALAEDIGEGDVTTLALVPESAAIRAAITARESGIVAGSRVACFAFRRLDPLMEASILIPDGARVSAGQTILELRGRARAILTAERTALNFMQKMTGSATLTRKFVDRVKAYAVTILDTRKTAPGLRVFEKYAVRCGGGENHRMGLYDRFMIKDNHRRFWAGAMTRTLGEAVETARRAFPGIPVEVEVENLSEIEDALRAQPEWILLDNMTPRLTAEGVAAIAGRARVESSGGITLDNVEHYARCGVDAISLGCLTHSAAALDLSLEIL